VADLSQEIDEKLARQRAHESNIARYRHLLQTRLSDIERHFIEERLAEERTALSALAVDGLDASTESLRHAAEDTPSGSGSSDIEKTPVFDRAGAAPKI
jgi:hypothetical protein